MHWKDAAGRSSPVVRASLRWHLDRDGWPQRPIADPDVGMIETAPADGMVAREIISAGLFELRTTANYRPSNPRRDVSGMQPGPTIYLPSRRAGIPDEKNDCEQARKPRTIFPTAVARESRKPNIINPTHKQNAARRSWAGAAPQAPRDLSPCGQSRRDKTKTGRCLRPASGLGTWHGARVASPRCPILRPGSFSVTTPCGRNYSRCAHNQEKYLQKSHNNA